MRMIKWTATRIDAANYGICRYYLKYCHPDKPKQLRLSVYAKGSLLHKLIEHFWNKLGTPDEVSKKSSGKKYFDAESFTQHALRQWNKIVKGSEKTKNIEKKIAWRYENEMWVIKNELPKICAPLFNYFIKEGQPLFSEKKFSFLANGILFGGWIDEVRLRDNKPVVRDYKSGMPFMREMKLNGDPQLTLYNAGLCSLCKADKNIAKQLGLEDRVGKYFTNGNYIDPEINLEFFMIEAPGADPKKYKTPPQIIIPTKREEQHFIEIISMIDCTERAIERMDVYPERGKKCDICDMKHKCKDMLPQAGKGELVDKKGQLYFEICFPANFRNTEQAKRALTAKQLNLRGLGLSKMKKTKTNIIQ